VERAKSQAEQRAADAALEHKLFFVIQRNKAERRELLEQARREYIAAYWSGFGRGLGTGTKAIGNAVVDTAVSFGTLGFFDSLHVFGGQDEIGYQGSYLSARIGTELLAGVGTGGLSTVSKVGWVGKLGKGIFIWDVGGNAVMVGKGGIGIAQNGLNLQNGVQVFGGLFGLGGNVAGRYGRNLPLGRSTDDAAEALPSRAVPRATGQIHHPISTRVHRALEGHPNLRGHYQARDPRFTTRALNEEAHRGYQRWHRQLDEEVADWIENAPIDTTPQQFEDWLRRRYSQPDLQWRFPNGF